MNAQARVARVPPIHLEAEVLKTLFIECRFNCGHFNSLGYCSFFHHPDINTPKGQLTPDGISILETKAGYVLFEYKGHATDTNMENRIAEDTRKFATFRSVKPVMIRGLPIVPAASASKNTIWIYPEEWLDSHDGDYYSHVRSPLDAAKIATWTANIEPNRDIRLEHKSGRHADGRLNNNDLIVPPYKRNRCQVLNNDSPLADLVAAMCLAIQKIAMERVSEFTMEQILQSLETENYLIARRRDFMRRFDDILRKLEGKGRRRAIIRRLRPRSSAKEIRWQFVIQVQEGPDESRLNALDRACDMLQREYSVIPLTELREE